MVNTQPQLETERLLLRPFTMDDAADLQRLAGDPEIAATTLRIPHPYEDGIAEQWLAEMPARFEKNEEVVFAVEIFGMLRNEIAR